MGKRIYVIEDDPVTKSYLEGVIHDLDEEACVEWAETAEEALENIDREIKSGREYDLVIADIFLAGKRTGIDVWQTCAEELPGVPILITSALPISDFFESIGQNRISPPYLPKPYFRAECSQMIKGLLAMAR